MNAPEIERNASITLSAMLQHDAGGWHLLGVVPDPVAHAGPPERRLVREGDDSTIYQWCGLRLRLSPREADDYIYNLTSRCPMLYLICKPGTHGEPVPLRVTADQDDGVAAIEVDEMLLQAPMPRTVVGWLQHYVETHWTPGPRKRSRGDKDRREKPGNERPRSERP